MANKRERQATILELIKAQAIGSQEELREQSGQKAGGVTPLARS